MRKPLEWGKEEGGRKGEGREGGRRKEGGRDEGRKNGGRALSAHPKEKSHRIVLIQMLCTCGS